MKLILRVMGPSLLGVLLLGVPGCAPGTGAPDADVDRPAEVAAIEAVVADIHPALPLSGTLVAIPEQSAEVHSQVPGIISKLNVLPGTQVAVGDVIVEFDASLFIAARDKASAAADAARAVFALLEAGPRPEEVNATRNACKQANAVAGAARAKLDALKPLIEKNEISPVRLSQARAEVEAAEAAAAAAQSQFELLQAGARSELLAEAQARFAEADAELSARQNDLEHCIVRSPSTGTVANLAVLLGSAVDAQTLIASVVDTSTLFVQVRVPAIHVLDVDSAQAAAVQLPSGSLLALAASFVRKAPEADPQTGDTDLFFRIDNADNALQPGLTCTVDLPLRTVRAATVVPLTALANRDGAAILSVIREGKAYELEVKIGARTDDQVQILEGVIPGDFIITQGGYGLPEAYPVSVKDQSPAVPGV